MNAIDLILVNADMVDLYPVFLTRTVRKNPPRVPLGPCYLAACARAAGHSVAIIDNYLDARPNRAVTESILARNPRVVGFSVSVANVANALEIASAIKKSAPRVRTVFGGPQATIMPEALAAHACVDYVLAGEGERSLPLLLEHLVRQGTPPLSVNGLYFRDERGAVAHTGPHVWIDDLDSIPLPARDLVDFDRYDLRGNSMDASRVATVSTSRGCPYRCAFCASEFYFPKKYRYRNAVNVADEIEGLIERYRIDGVYFREDCFTVNRARVLELCAELARRRLSIAWECEARVDSLDPELMRVMHEAGCRGMWCGVESGCQKTLDYLQKGVTVAQIRDAYRWGHEVGIKMGAGFMVGVPGETMEDAFRSLGLAREIDPCWAYFQSFVGYPRSRVYDDIVRRRLFVGEFNGILDVQTEELTRGEIRAIENYSTLEFNQWKNTAAAEPSAGVAPSGGWPSVTVIVPAHDASRSIEECLVSLCNLDYPEEKLEILVVDNGSRDRTREIAARFPIICLEQRETNSSYRTRNVGVERAKGRIIAFTDSDCVVTRSWLKDLLAGCDDPRYGCFAGEVLPYAKETMVDEYLARTNFMSHKEILSFRPLPRAQTANLAFRRGVFDRIGPFDRNAISGGDSEMVIRMLTATEWNVRYNGRAVVFHKHRTRPWPFFTQFVRYGWGEAKLISEYDEYYHAYVGVEMGRSVSKIISNAAALARGAAAGLRGKRADPGAIAMPLLDTVWHIAWNLGLQSGLAYRKYIRGRSAASPPPPVRDMEGRVEFFP